SEGCQAGLAFNPATPINEEMIHYISDKLDLILIMTVNPGFGGQKFIKEMLAKISQLRNFLDKHKLNHIKIQVDGGIDLNTCNAVIQAGAEILVAGSAVFGKSDINKATQEMLNKMSE